MKNMDNYADLIIRSGINIQQDQILVIKASVELAEFVRLCAVKAYEAGAKEVVVRWLDKKLDRIFYDMAQDQVFDQVDEWKVQRDVGYAKKGASFLSILSSDPDIMSGVDPKRMSRVSKAYAKPMKPYSSRLMSNRNAWCIVSMPSMPWAVKVYPDLSPEAALEALWDAILKATRADLDHPVDAWAKHQLKLNQKLDVLNSTKFRAFKYHNSLGTDLTVALPPDQVWYGGADTHYEKGYPFIANIPTEEIFSAPKMNGVDGTVYASYPLVYHGVTIEDMWFKFKDGVVIDYGSSSNYEVLKEMLETDAGARRLGEIALVPYDSPISNQNILFYETLFDENAACHFAFGEAYPICIEGGEDMDEATLLANNINVSDIHVDFMVGTKDLEITGIMEDGTEVQIFHKGNFSI